MQVYPSILTDSLEEFQTELSLVQDSGVVSVVQVDIIDGYFADNLTVTPLDLTQLDFGDVQLDFHLMVEEPMDFVHELVGIREYLPIRAVIGQVERMSHQGQFLQEVRSQQWQAGLSLDLYTPVSAIDAPSWPDLDIVQIMTVEAGFQGQEFHPSALEKVQQIRSKSPHALEVLADGGIKEKHLPLLKKAGVDGIVVGSGIWGSHEN